MSANAFTQEQIFSGLRIIWREALGYEATLDLDMRFVDEFKGGGLLEEIDFGDVIWRIQREFGFTCEVEEWKTFLGLPAHDPDAWERDVAPRLTFRALISFILERLKPVTFAPIMLLGKPCLTAGIFRALEQLAGQIQPNVKHFAPSTPIRARLRGLRLRQFYERLRWMTNERIPEPPRERKLGWRIFDLKSAIGLVLALWYGDAKEFWLGFQVTVFLFLLTKLLVEIINSWMDPIPKEIRTFGDLARYLAVITVDQKSEYA